MAFGQFRWRATLFLLSPIKLLKRHTLAQFLLLGDIDTLLAQEPLELKHALLLLFQGLLEFLFLALELSLHLSDFVVSLLLKVVQLFLLLVVLLFPVLFFVVRLIRRGGR